MVNRLSELKDDEFVSNPTARTPCCLVLDISGSMYGDPINELQRGVELFVKELKNDDYAYDSAEVAVVTFGGVVRKVSDFCSVEDIRIPRLEADGMTPMGEAVNMAIDMVKRRKKLYSDAGIDYHQPWLVLMTDGRPEGEDENITRTAAAITSKMVNEKDLVIIPIGIGSGADREILSTFSPKWEPLKLDGLNFKEFFLWLSASMARQSASFPGDKQKVDKDGMKEWVDPKGWDEF